MGVFSSEKVSNLYWMGRYVDRTQTTLKLFSDSFDRMIDGDENHYQEFCAAIGIPDAYSGKEDFVRRYPFDAANPYSIVSNINRAFDNAVVMRDFLGSDTLSYLQMTIYDLKNAEQDEERAMIHLQDAIDHLMAFWGCLDDMVDDDATRNIIKVGKQLEHLDLDLRLRQAPSTLRRDYTRLENRICKSELPHDRAVMDTLSPMLYQDRVDCENALRLLHKLLLIS